MPLPRHTRTKKGTYRKAPGNETARNLAKDYPEFKKVPPNTKLETLRRRYGVTSINGVRAALRRKK